MAPAGPAWERTAPEATKSPVPIDPPRAIIVRCRADKERLSVVDIVRGKGKLKET